ncbi:high affinity nerve growth factor receptor-like isoform X2 [Rhynchophorus ferrugineus]|uniref:high affinity nerve growth factor receptor-like isoform X2 n=1 Tax=Rhynchophorus ferrugineus TaxID=354439 RepID=UPI003FCCE027
MRIRNILKRRAVENMEEERVQVFHDGICSMGKCKGETACKNFPNNSYTCVCTHDSLPPTLNGACPRRIVKNFPGRIPNVQPPSITKPKLESNSTQKSTLLLKNQTVLLTSSELKVPLSVTTAVIIVILLLITIYVVCTRKIKRRNETASPMILKRSLLIPERYAPNPQYSACCSTDVPVIRKETLKFLNELGEGCFGKVYKGELSKTADLKPDIVAIKVLKESATKEAEEDFFREVEIMSAFQHPNILSFVGVVLRDGNVNPMMVFEYMEHGDLAEVLRSQRRFSSESIDSQRNLPQLDSTDILGVALQIANGMEYLAAQRFVHRDLACRNCLVAEGPTVKIADFGMSRDVYTCDYYKIGGSRLLPVRWMSPESVVYGRFTLESDIWSYGIVLWEIYSYGKQPYYGHSNEEVVKLILDGIMLIPPEDCPSFVCGLMKNCWKTEPKHRITFTLIKKVLEEAYYNKKAEVKEFNLNKEREDDASDTLTKCTVLKTSTSLECGITYNNELRKPEAGDAKQLSMENSSHKKSTELKMKTLPRPPPLPKSVSKTDLLDTQGYLLPSEIKEPVQYLRTLPA